MTDNKEQIYDAQVSPLVAQIVRICREHGIPMLCHFAIPTPENNGLCATSAMPMGNERIADATRALLSGMSPETGGQWGVKADGSPIHLGSQALANGATFEEFGAQAIPTTI